MKFFNTAGPIQTDIHYFLPPLERMNKDELLSLIAARKYFVLHAPRQTGKTTALLADELNHSGAYRALYVNVGAAQAAREDVQATMSAILNQIALQAQLQLQDDYPDQQSTRQNTKDAKQIGKKRLNPKEYLRLLCSALRFVC